MTNPDLEYRLSAIERKMAEICLKLERDLKETKKFQGFYPPEPIPFHLLLDVSRGQVGQ